MSKKKILIVEDELAIQMALEDDFLVEGYEVDTASDGLEGFQKAKDGDKLSDKRMSQDSDRRNLARPRLMPWNV